MFDFKQIDFTPTHVESINAVNQATIQARRALGCEILTPELQQSLIPFLDFINDNMVINDGYMGYQPLLRQDVPHYLLPRLKLLFHDKSNLATFSWMWDHFGTTYVVDEFLISSPEYSTDVVIRVSTEDWMISFSTSKFLGFRRDTEPKVTVYSGWVDYLPYIKKRRVNDIIDFKIHNGEEAFYRDLIMLKLSL